MNPYSHPYIIIIPIFTPPLPLKNQYTRFGLCELRGVKGFWDEGSGFRDV